MQAHCSPKDVHAIGAQTLVAADEGHALASGLYDEHPVERVLTMQRQPTDLERVVKLDGQDAEARIVTGSLDPRLDIIGERQLSLGGLDRDLPGVDHAGEHRVARI